MIQNSCRLCGEQNLELILDLGDQPWGNDFKRIDEEIVVQKYPLQFVVCRSCYLAQINFTIPKEDLFLNHTYVSGTTRALRAHFISVGKELFQRYGSNKDSYVVDIGGNDGTFLEFIQKQDIEVLNVDSGIIQSEISNSKGIRCINRFFNEEVALELLKDKGPAYIIHGSGIFFHLEELYSVFKGIKKLLQEDGILVAEFIYLPEMLKNCAYDQIYHEHLLYYSISTFQKLLDHFDLEVFDAKLVPIHGGSCVTHVCHKGRKNISNRLLHIIKNEHAIGMEKIETYIDFRKKALSNKTELMRIIDQLNRDRLTIQAMGAPVKGSTIINYCGLSEREIQCAVEINPHKFNTYYPGTKIPVYDQHETPHPDVYLLLAWNFSKEITEKLKEFNANGGQILLPIPKPKLI